MSGQSTEIIYTIQQKKIKKKKTKSAATQHKNITEKKPDQTDRSIVGFGTNSSTYVSICKFFQYNFLCLYIQCAYL